MDKRRLEEDLIDLLFNAPSCLLPSRAFGSRKRMKIGFFDLVAKFCAFSVPLCLRGRFF